MPNGQGKLCLSHLLKALGSQLDAPCTVSPRRDVETGSTKTKNGTCYSKTTSTSKKTGFATPEPCLIPSKFWITYIENVWQKFNM